LTSTTRTRIDGHAEVASLGASYPLIRAYQRNLTLSASIDGVNSDNAVLGSLLSRERTRAARGAASVSDVGAKHDLSASLSVSRGLDILGADTAVTLADPRFVKVAGKVALNRSFGKHVIARFSTAGQWSRDPLPAVERFIVGGPDFGRAFPVAALAADRGDAESLELAWRPRLPTMFDSSELYVFGDRAGAVRGVRLRPGISRPGRAHSFPQTCTAQPRSRQARRRSLSRPWQGMAIQRGVAAVDGSLSENCVAGWLAKT
jgi:hemolysin activation/secretion protein